MRLARRKLPLALLALLVSLTAVLAACGGSDDTAGGSGDSGGGGGTELSLVAYAVPKPGFDKLIPAFTKTPEGEGATFKQSYGPSGDQSRKVESGLKADLVNFSVEPDVTRLVDAGRVDADWNKDENKGLAFGSVVTIVTRKGNPKGIKDWQDLLQPGLEVVTPNPFSSGSAKWNLLAPYAAESNGGKDQKAGLDFVSKLVKDHVKVQPKSGREATETFLQGTGDVLLSYENEAIFAKRQGEDVDYVTPPTTFKIENPVAVLGDSEHKKEAEAFKTFLYSDEGQKLWAEAGFRPVNQSILEQYKKDFPDPQQLWTIADLGGWSKVDDEFFDEEKGSIAKIYEEATG